MPWAGATFNRTDSTRVGASVWVDADSAGVPILPSDHDTHDQDIADGLEETVKHNGDIPMTGDLDMGGNAIDNASRIDVNSASGPAFKATSNDSGSGSGPVFSGGRHSGSPDVGDLGATFKAAFFDSSQSEVPGCQFRSRLRDPVAGQVETAWEAVVMDGDGGEVTGCIFGKDGLEDKGGVLVQSHNTAQLPQQSASGTEVEFSNAVTPDLISADATQIIITFAGLAHNAGVGHGLALSLGTSAGYVVASYFYVLRRLSAGISDTSPTTDWLFATNVDDTEPVRGTVVLDRIEGSDVWQITGNVASIPVPENFIVAGSLTLPGVLDRFKLRVIGGASWATGTVSATVVT